MLKKLSGGQMKIEESGESMNIDSITFLLDYCSEHADIYNEVANNLWERFHLRGAELCLLITYFVNEERRHE